jgi:hypothetical protein
MMQLYRVNERGEHVPYNVVDLPLQKARRLTPTPDPTIPQEPKQRDRSADMLGLVLLVLIAGLWFAAGYIVGVRR